MIKWLRGWLVLCFGTVWPFCLFDVNQSREKEIEKDQYLFCLFCNIIIPVLSVFCKIWNTSCDCSNNNCWQKNPFISLGTMFSLHLQDVSFRTNPSAAPAADKQRSTSSQTLNTHPDLCSRKTKDCWVRVWDFSLISRYLNSNFSHRLSSFGTSTEGEWESWTEWTCSLLRFFIFACFSL